MALAIRHILDPEPKHGGLLVQTPRSGADRIGTYAEVIDADSNSDISVECADPFSSQTASGYADAQGWVQRDELSAGREDESVRERLGSHEPIFLHHMFCAEDDQSWFEDSMSVALIDGQIPSPEAGWEDASDGTALLHYPIETSVRDAEALGKMHRTMQDRGADLSYVGIIQLVLDVEAPISLFSSYLHDDSGYALYRPQSIFQTMYAGLEDARGEIFSASTHYTDAGLIQP